jgi:gamma-glutamyl-gamma-aminobutyrate hydrolase PuuD
MVPRTYPAAVQRAGGIAWVMPPDRVAEQRPGEWLGRIDALLLVGGSDVGATLYGAAPDPQTDEPWPERDSFEVALAAEAIERGMPVLGICRGMQLLNVSLGGTLEQHLPDRIGSTRHREKPGVFGVHEVRLEPGSIAERAVGADHATVRSHHHQGVADLGTGLVASGWSLEDDVVEAIELDGNPFCLGVLWHPEEDVESRVIGALVEAARGGTDRDIPGSGAEEMARND